MQQTSRRVRSSRPRLSFTEMAQTRLIYYVIGYVYIEESDYRQFTIAQNVRFKTWGVHSACPAWRQKLLILF